MARKSMFGMFPNVGAIESKMNEKFDQLYAVLLEIRDELRLQRPEPK
jgi:hypothetical protein